MAASDVLAGSKKPTGTGTKVSGYVDTPVPKKCATCEYLVNGTLCKNSQVLKDPEIPTAKRSRLKKVSAEDGCCSFWEPKEASRD